MHRLTYSNYKYVNDLDGVRIYLYKYISLQNAGCLIPHCRSNDAEVPTVSTETQCPLTQGEKEEDSGSLIELGDSEETSA